MEITSLSGISAGDGILSIVDGKIHFDPGTEFDHLDAGQSRSFNITYTVSSSTGSDDATLNVTVNGVTDGPVAVTDSAEVFTNAVAQIDVLANDSDPSGDLAILDITGVSDTGDILSVVNGKIEFDPGTAFDYLGAGQAEYIQVTYIISNDDGSDNGYLTITVNGIAGDPIAIDDTVSLYEHETILVDVLANDGSSGGNLEITAVDGISAGTGTLSVVDGKIEFEPGAYFDDLDAGQTATLDINYTVSDDNGTDQGTVTFTINGIGDDPIAIDDTAQTIENEVLLIDVLANDIDLEGDLEIIAHSSGESIGGGTVSVVDGKIEFDPGTDFYYLGVGESVDLIINYEVSNGTGGDNGELTLTVTGKATPTISIDDISANEVDETATFTVTLSETSDQTITVDYSVAGGTSGTLTFLAGETSQTFTSSWADDNVFEIDETFTATLTNPTNAIILDETGTLTVIDDDGPQAKLDSSSASTIWIYSADDDTIIGGEGHDTLLFENGDDVNLSTIFAVDLEKIDISENGINDISLTLQDLIDITDSDNHLIITGGNEDFVTSTGEGWVQGSDQIIDTGTYHTYTSGTGTLLIDENITQDIS